LPVETFDVIVKTFDLNVVTFALPVETFGLIVGTFELKVKTFDLIVGTFGLKVPTFNVTVGTFSLPAEPGAAGGGSVPPAGTGVGAPVFPAFPQGEGDAGVTDNAPELFL
jgi:hypothetical protein